MIFTAYCSVRNKDSEKRSKKNVLKIFDTTSECVEIYDKRTASDTFENNPPVPGNTGGIRT